MNGHQRLAFADVLANRRVNCESGGWVDLVLLADTSGAKIDARQPDLECVDPCHVTVSVGRHFALDSRCWQAALEMPALSRKHLLEFLAARA